MKARKKYPRIFLWVGKENDLASYRYVKEQGGTVRLVTRDNKIYDSAFTYNDLISSSDFREIEESELVLLI